MNKAVVFFLHRIHAVSIGNTADNLYNVIGHHMAELGVKGVEPRELIDLIDGYTLGGHGCVDKTLKGKVLLLCHCQWSPTISVQAYNGLLYTYM